MQDENYKLPGIRIREEMQKRGWNQAILAEVLGIQPSVISQVILGKRGISLELAVGLSAAFGYDPKYWVDLDTEHKLNKVDMSVIDPVRKRAQLYQVGPIKEMEKRGWIRHTQNVQDLDEELRRFFAVDNLTECSFQAVARKTNPDDEFSGSHVAWLARAKQLAKLIPAGVYREETLRKNLPRLRILATQPDLLSKLPKALASLGVRLVIVEHLAQTKIDGAAFWLDENSPAIALSLRYDRIDYAWFTIAHELFHVLNRDVAPIDSDLRHDMHIETPLDEIEQRANQEAAEFLLSQEKLDSFILRVKPFYGRERIVQFANLHRVHPGIVVGQLQHRKEIGFNHHKDFLSKVRHIVTATALTDGWGRIIPSI